MKLTQSSIAKLTSSKADAIFFDDDLPSFGLRIRAGGSKKFIVQYRLGGIQRRYTLGSAAALTLEQARHKARKVLVDVGEGKDPAAEREVQHAAAGLLFASAVDDYLKVCAQELRSRTLAEYTRYLKELWKPLNKLALDKITLSIVAANLRTIAEKHSSTQANRARSCLSAMFAWVIGEGLCSINPVIGTNKKKENGPRTRALTDTELVAIWKACPQSDFGAIIRLLMLTACRREEIAQLRWAEIDHDTKLITLPAARTKNGVKHEVPLSDAAMEVLQTIPHQRDILFGHGLNGFSGFAKAKRALDKASGVANWTVHDIRRTVRTGLGKLGVAPHVAEAVLNHLPAKLIRTYDRNTYEKRAALDNWANHIRFIIAQSEGANVHKLKRIKPDPRMIFARTRQTWGERSGHLVPNHHAKNTFLQCGRRWISRPSPAQQPQAPRPLRYYSIQGLDGSGGGASTTLAPAARISFSRAIRVVSKKLPDAAVQVRAIKGVAENQKSECPGGRSRSRRDVLTATTLITCLLGALL